MIKDIEPLKVVLHIRRIGQFRSLICSGDARSSLVIGQCSRGLGFGSTEGAGMGGLTGAGFVEAVVARRGLSRASGRAAGGVRFAFYGRMSTSEFQDPWTSRAWQ